MLGSLLDPRLGELDKAIDLLSNTLKNNAADVTSEIDLEDVLSRLFSSEDAKELQSILSSVQLPRERIKRYDVYDDLYDSVQIIKSIINIYTSSILQGNPLTGDRYIIRKKEKDEEKTVAAENFVRNFIQHFQFFEKYLRSIVPKMLKYGEMYLEIVDLNSVNIANIGKYLVEESLPSLNGNIDAIGKSIDATVEFTDISSNLDLAVLFEQADDDRDLTRFMLIQHRPHNTIPLQTKYGTLLGYIEVTRGRPIEYTFESVVKYIQRTSRNTDVETASKQLIQYLIRKILTSAGDKLSGKLRSVLSDPTITPIEKQKLIDKLIKDSLNEEAYVSLKVLYQNLLASKHAAQVRFIPVSHMVRFYVPSVSGDEGESVIDPLVLPGRLYLLTQLANIIAKLSRSAVIRKWIVEAGPGRQHGNLVQKLRDELRNARITVDNLASFKAIPRILTDFKDMILIQQGGRRYLDLEVTALGDPSVKVADLQDARQELIALSKIPSAYLGYADAIQLRELLVHTNVVFATTVLDIQNCINRSISELIDKIAAKLDFDFKPSDYVTVSLIPPTVLILQLVEMVIGIVANVASALNNIGVASDPYYLLETYAPFIDWKQWKRKAEEYQVKQQ